MTTASPGEVDPYYILFIGYVIAEKSSKCQAHWLAAVYSMPLRRAVLIGMGCCGSRAVQTSAFSRPRHLVGTTTALIVRRHRMRRLTSKICDEKWSGRTAGCQCALSTIRANGRTSTCRIACFSGKRYFSGASNKRQRNGSISASRRRGDERAGKGSARQGPHPRNSFKGSYDMERLCAAYPPLRNHIIQPDERSKSKRPTIKFADPEAVRALNTALLVSDYDIAPSYADIMPEDALVPPVPGRVDYVHYVADVLGEMSDVPVRGDDGTDGIPTGPAVTGLDIGTGASAIYSLLANSEYGWSMIGSEVNPPSLTSACAIVKANNLQHLVDIRLQESPQCIFHGILRPKEKVDFVMCNPPFFSSLEAFQAENTRKVRGLARGGANRYPPGAVVKAEERKRAWSATRTSNNFGGTASELWCDGGEVSFVKRIVDESKEYADHCLWFTSLVSRRENLEKIERYIMKANTGLKPAEVRKTSMGAGTKSASIIMWTYMNAKKRQQWASSRWPGYAESVSRK